MALQADWAVTNLWSDPGLLRSEVIHEAAGCKIGCKLGKSRLRNLQKLCYSLRLGSYRKLRVNPDVSIAAKEKAGGEPGEA